MKKTLLYVLLLLILIGGLYLLLGKEKGGFSKKESNFTVKDTADIGKIFLAGMAGDTILLERNGTAWTLNKYYRAMTPLVNTLLVTLRTQVGVHPVPEKAHNSVVKALSGTAVKVQVYNRKNELVREFYVGGETKDFDGSYMLMSGAERPFVVEIPGFAGYLTTRYSTDLLDWRDRSIFLLRREDISRVSLQYPAEPLNSFVVNQDANGNITVETDPGLSSGKELNKRRVELFLTFFEKIYSEGYITEGSEIRQVLDTIPKRAIIDITTKDGKTNHLDIYWRPVFRRSKNLIRKAEGIPEQFDSDRGYGVLNNFKDTVVVQYQVFDRIFRNAWEFYEEDK